MHQSNPNSFTTLCIGKRGMQVCTQDRRRKKNVLTGLTSAIRKFDIHNPSDNPEQKFAKLVGANIIVRIKEYSHAKHYRY